MTVTQSHVEKVRCQRVLLVTSRVPAQVRKALNAAVLKGDLGHLAKSGRKPEAYFWKTFECLAHQERGEEEKRQARAIVAAHAAILVRPFEDLDPTRESEAD